MIEIVPAIDMIGGKCVRLSKGDYATKKVYNENPLEVAKMFEDNGITRLHLVDLDGAKAGHIVNLLKGVNIFNHCSADASVLEVDERVGTDDSYDLDPWLVILRPDVLQHVDVTTITSVFAVPDALFRQPVLHVIDDHFRTVDVLDELVDDVKTVVQIQPRLLFSPVVVHDRRKDDHFVDVVIRRNLLHDFRVGDRERIERQGLGDRHRREREVRRLRVDRHHRRLVHVQGSGGQRLR